MKLKNPVLARHMQVLKHTPILMVDQLIEHFLILCILFPFALQRVESCLSRVEQSPANSMQIALSSPLIALIGDKLLRHSDPDVKVAVASCISEITRITAPDAPYDDDQMKVCIIFSYLLQFQWTCLWPCSLQKTSVIQLNFIDEIFLVGGLSINCIFI